MAGGRKFVQTPRSPGWKANAWRARLGLAQAPDATFLEAADDDQPAIAERIELARAQMRQLVITQFGGDQALLDGVEALAFEAGETTELLRGDLTPNSALNWISLEAVVAFDGSRPSFLIQNGEIRLDSSLSTGRFHTELSPYLAQLSDMAACVGRLNRGETHMGTAFLISPDLILTNRHVAQSISFATEEGRLIAPSVSLDFGHEHQARVSYDRRQVLTVVALGLQAIDPFQVDHTKLDLALLRVSPSTLTGPAKDRFLRFSPTQGALEAGLSVVTAGYPVAWTDAVPPALQTQHATVLARLLAGDAGAKRLSPGLSQGMLASGEAPSWTGLHDATTLRGNSGSPMAVLSNTPLKVRGLHYGGVALGERVNWVHLLSQCVGAPCLPSGKLLGEILAAEGVAL